MSAIAVTDLVKHYGPTRAVDGISFEVAAGEVLALLGPNGAGKTTTVECIAGLRAPDAGTVRVLGADPRAQRDRIGAELGMMLQDGGVHRSATPRALLRLFAAYVEQPLDAADLIDDLELSGFLDQRVRTLSGGQRQRVAFALALIGRPRLALLDEPTAGMDPHARTRAWRRITALAADGVAVVLSTHSLEEAERLADRVAVIDAGELLALDRPQALTDGVEGVQVEAVGPIDAAALAAALGCPVRPLAPGRVQVDTAAERLAEVATVCAGQGVALRTVSVARARLEDVYLRLTDRSVR